MQRILVNTGTNLRRTFTVDGDLTPADGNVTITVVDEAGTTVVGTTNSIHEGSAVYRYTLAPQTAVKRLTVTWSGTWSGVVQSVVEYVEIVGAHLFTESEARTFHDSALASATDYPDADIAEARDRITDEFEHVCNVSFVPRYERETMPGTGTRELVVSKRRVTDVIAASINGTAQNTANIEVLYQHSDTLHHTTNLWSPATISNPRNVTVEYQHGYDSPPLAIKRAALMVLRNTIVDSNIGDRVVSLTDSIGTMRLAQPGFRGVYFGIPAVDRILDEYSESVPIA